MTKQIITVQGPIDPATLGFTSMHDHIMFNGAPMVKKHRQNLPSHQYPIQMEDKVSLENVGILHRNIFLAADAHNQDDEEALTGEVADYKQAGGQAILEVSVPGVSLDTEANLRISRQTGVHIIVCTGLYTWDSWPEAYRGLSVAQHYQRMMHEINNGLDNTTIRPGHVKIAVGYLNRDEENALRAAAQTARDSGLSLTAHPSHSAGDRLRILDIIKEEGLCLTRVVMAHTAVVDKPSFAEVMRRPESYRVNIETALRMLDRGCNISKELMNTLGLELLGVYDAGDWADISGLVALISRGYGGQIVLGNDCCAKIMLKRFGGEGFCRLLWYTLPMLRDVAGVSAHVLQQIFVENPARILSQ
ncbi:MAG: phosphotriesterase [Clostridiales bacterium]|nr:phosphotriesterase [Clostridiales bacterium]